MAKKSSVVFKSHTPNQAMLLPPSLDELIAKTIPARLVNDVIDKIIKSFTSKILRRWHIKLSSKNGVEGVGLC